MITVGFGRMVSNWLSLRLPVCAARQVFPRRREVRQSNGQGGYFGGAALMFDERVGRIWVPVMVVYCILFFSYYIWLHQCFLEAT